MSVSSIRSEQRKSLADGFCHKNDFSFFPQNTFFLFQSIFAIFRHIYLYHFAKAFLRMNPTINSEKYDKLWMSHLFVISLKAAKEISGEIWRPVWPDG